MGRSPCSDNSGLKKGPWTPDEDEKLVKYVQEHGHSSWRALPKLAGTRFVYFFLYLVKRFILKFYESKLLFLSLYRSKQVWEELQAKMD